MTLDPARVFAALDRHGVDDLTIGAFAVIAHGYVRATADIDPTDPDTLANGASFTLDADAGPVNYLNDAPGAADHADLRARSVKAVVGVDPQ